MKKFALQDYPFDTQRLTVRIASSKYMLNELVLLPDKGVVNGHYVSGVKENIWGLYSFERWDANSYNTSDGVLEKSRGAMEITLKRKITKYYEDHLVPSFIALMISWAVFYFPFANFFITPRLALSILALLTFTNLMVKSSKELPGAAPFNWNDLFNQQIQTLMFITILLNICAEIAFHTFKKEGLARLMNNHAKVLMPMMSIINIVMILGGGASVYVTQLSKACDWTMSYVPGRQHCVDEDSARNLGMVSNASKASIVFFAVVYVSHISYTHLGVGMETENALRSRLNLRESARSQTLSAFKAEDAERV
jgi:hypothetical protein